MSAQTYWSVEECRWVPSPTRQPDVLPVPVPEQREAAEREPAPQT